MAERTLTLPTTSALPSAHRVSSQDISTQRTLSKVSRPALINLVQEWLRPHNLPTCRPVIGNAIDDSGGMYDLEQSIDDVREVYKGFQQRRGNKREVVDRIIEGDWRDGVSLRQLAMADIQYLMEHPTSQKWVALKLTRTRQPLAERRQAPNGEGRTGVAESQKAASPEKDTRLPRFEAPVFLHRLQAEIGSLLKAHYHLTHLPNLPLTLLRIAVLDLPYNSQAALQQTSGDMWKTLFMAFPDNTPYVYVATTSALGGPNGPDGKSLRSLFVDAIPRAFSKRGERYTLESTFLSAKSLGALLVSRGSGRSNAAGGGWSVFAKGTVEGTPLMVSTKDQEEEEAENAIRVNTTVEANTSKTRKRALTHAEATRLLVKKRRLIAKERFGDSAMPTDGQGIDKLSIRIEDAYPISTKEQRTVLTTFLAKRDGIEPDSEVQTARKNRNLEASLLGDPTSGDKAIEAGDAENENEEDDNDTTGNTTTKDSGKGKSPSTSNTGKAWKPAVTITFHGTHIFAGIRSLVEAGVVNGQSMPGWMTGEEGVSLGVVRDGKVLKSWGSGG